MVTVKNLVKHHKDVKAVDGISFSANVLFLAERAFSISCIFVICEYILRIHLKTRNHHDDN